MSIINIKAAIETAINGMTPVLPTAWENIPYNPIAGTPYQQVWFLSFMPGQREFGITSHQVNSYFQIDLLYPLLAGTNAVLNRAELIKSLFKQGSTFTNAGQSVNITQTPTVSSGRVEGDRWKVSVKVYYSAWIVI